MTIFLCSSHLPGFFFSRSRCSGSVRRMTTWKIGLSFLLAMVMLAAYPLQAETYHRIALADLKFDQGQEDLEDTLNSNNWVAGTHPELLSLQCSAECYLASPSEANRADILGEMQAVFRLPDQKPVNGTLDLPIRAVEHDGFVSQRFTFTLDPAEAPKVTKEKFHEVRKLHYARLQGSGGLPGGAWFRHLAEINKPLQGRFNNANRDQEFDRTFQLFSGSRAVAQNIALDRELILGEANDEKGIALNTIKGITVPAIRWGDRLPADKVKVDPLSLHIPADQHAVFFPSLQSLFDTLDRLESRGSPILQSLAANSPYQSLTARYRRQLGLDFPDVAARLLSVKSVAVTGSDPFFPTGTDVAILFETEKPEALFKALSKGIRVKATQAKAAARPWKNEGTQYLGFQTPDRTFSSHLLRRGNLVVIANSAVQLRRLLAIGEDHPALGNTDEFRFFRHRYPISKERSFVFISDETLRRWCGPSVRIGASRRSLALAAMTALNARIRAGEGDKLDEFAPLLGQVTKHDGFVLSEHFGTVAFVSPLAEMKIDTVSKRERDAYDRWRTGYERGWANVFDPIALEIGVTKQTADIDLTVLPLTVGSDYRDFIELAGNSKLTPMARTVPPNALLHLAVAVDRKSELFREFDQELPGLLPELKVNPLGWMGESISFTLEDGYFWDAIKGGLLEDDLEMLFHMPLLVRVESNSRLKLAAFLTALKAAINQSAPDLVDWSIRKHNKRSYVVVSGDDEEFGTATAVYYAALPKALLISLDEDVLRRAIDRELAGPSKEDTVPLSAGRQLLLQTSPQFLVEVTEFLGSGSIQQHQQRSSWRALPILNEWRKRFPDQDPLVVHRTTLGADLNCPGGKGYRWNAKAGTMESVAFGFPSAPRSDGKPLSLLADYGLLRAGLEFADGGLRANLHAGQAKPAPSLRQPGGKLLATAAELTSTKVGIALTYAGTGPEGAEKYVERLHGVTEKDGATVLLRKCTHEVGGEVYPHTDSLKLAPNGPLTLVHSEGIEPPDEFDDKESKWTTKYQIPPVDLPAELRMGMFMTYPFEGTNDYGEGESNSVRGEIQFRVLEVEDVTVPAGTFKDCILVEFRVDSVSDSFYDVDRSLHWFAKGVGAVKYETRRAGVSAVMELTDMKK